MQPLGGCGVDFSVMLRLCLKIWGLSWLIGFAFGLWYLASALGLCGLYFNY